jgi:hypothetical protein
MIVRETFSPTVMQCPMRRNNPCLQKRSVEIRSREARLQAGGKGVDVEGKIIHASEIDQHPRRRAAAQLWPPSHR